MSAAVVKGGQQRDTVAQEADQALVLEAVRDSQPASGISVAWEADAGELTGDSETNADGRARAQWVLGTTAGVQQARALVGAGSAAGVDTVRFRARGLPGPAAHLEVALPEDTLQMMLDTLALEVRAEDQYGNRKERSAARFSTPDTSFLTVSGDGEVYSWPDTVYHDEHGHFPAHRDSVPDSPGPRAGTVRVQVDSLTATAQLTQVSPIWWVNLSPDGVCMISMYEDEDGPGAWHGQEAEVEARDIAGRAEVIDSVRWSSEDTAIAKVHPDSMPSSRTKALVQGWEGGYTKVNATVFVDRADRYDSITDRMTVSIDSTKPLDNCPGPTPVGDVSASAMLGVDASTDTGSGEADGTATTWGGNGGRSPDSRPRP